jgi:uncharacterized protein
MGILVVCNLRCNFNCKYCYQGPVRKVKEDQVEYDIDKILDIIRKEYEATKSDITLHGGEPTVMPKGDIEKILKLSFELSGKSSIQTNGYMLDEDLFQLFLKYKTTVGFSIDGPYPLNQFRTFGDEKKREEVTNKILKNMDRCVELKISTSVICVIHKANGVGERREMLKKWLLELRDKRITGRLNVCGSEDPEIALTPEELKSFYLDMFDFLAMNEVLYWSPFSDFVNSITGVGEVVCTFAEQKDPYCTPSVEEIKPDGSISSCSRITYDGRLYSRSLTYSDIRSQILKDTDCKECKYWDYCHGGCCSNGIDGDWRRKDKYCEAYKAIFEKTLKYLKMFRIQTKLEKQQTQQSDQNKDDPCQHGGDYTDDINHVDGIYTHEDSDLRRDSGHGDRAHGDTPHGDA